MRAARSLLVLCMVTSLAVVGFGVVWGLHLIAQASGYRDRTGEGFVYIGLLAPMAVVVGGLFVAVLFAIVLGFAAQPERTRWARQSPEAATPVDESELDRKWARYMESNGA
jgi:hypothetical protein